LEVTIGGGRLQFLRTSTELRERLKHDKLGTERVYERVATPSEPAGCPQGTDELLLFEGRPDAAHAAYAVPTERGMRALLLTRDGNAELLEAAVDGTKLTWNSEPGCWTATRGELSVARSGNAPVQRYARDGEGLRPLGGVSPTQVYSPAR
jgi:hypothetical protein